jgi:hypothetical protein
MFHRASVGVSALRQVSLFQALDDQQIGQISLLLKERHYHKGAMVFHQGESGRPRWLPVPGHQRARADLP